MSESQVVAVLLAGSVIFAVLAAVVRERLPKLREKVEPLAASVALAASALFVKFTAFWS
jgi:hypothetical protein